MTTRLDLRTSLRERLEDTSPTPLWDDATLNDALWNSLIRYGVRFPLERSVSVAVPAGATSVPVSPMIPKERLLRVLDAAGNVMPEAISLERDVATGAQSWRWWNGTLLLTRALDGAETWSVEYRGMRLLPADDASTVDVNPGDEPIVVAMAAEVLLRRRAVEDMKRGLNSRPALACAEATMDEVNGMVRARRRTVRSGVLTVAQ
jgi:hypothetical protein